MRKMWKRQDELTAHCGRSERLWAATKETKRDAEAAMTDENFILSLDFW